MNAFFFINGLVWPYKYTRVLKQVSKGGNQID